MDAVDRDQMEQRQRTKARNRALILSGQVLPRADIKASPFTTLVPITSLTYEFQSGSFDRKPEKQRGKPLHMSPSSAPIT